MFVDRDGNQITASIIRVPIESGQDYIQVPYDAMRIWTEAERNAIGVFTAPDPQRVVIEQPPGPTFKADIWKRATDEECAAMDQRLNETTPRLRRIYEAAQIITRDDELWSVLNAAMIGLFGEERAAELLAPSD